MVKITISLFIVIFFISCKPKDSSKKDLVHENITDSLTHELIEIHKQGYINGFGVAIVNDKKVLYQHGIGYADIKSKTPYTENTIQNIASISKTLIGISLLKAQELGKLKLDDPINKYLPFEVKNPYFPNSVITIRQLATHTSTIADTDIYSSKSYILNDEQDSVATKQNELTKNFNLPDTHIGLEKFLKKTLNKNGEWYEAEGFLHNKPGEKYEYSNVGATLAAFIIEQATGQNYDEFSKKHILSPLKMNDSGWYFNQIEYSNFSTLYANPQTSIPYYSLTTYPDGGLITSINDLSKYLLELIKGYSGEGSLLTKSSYSEFFRQQLQAENFLERDENNPYNDEYNSGIFIGFSAKGFIGHTGGDPGVGSYMFFDSKKKTGRILIINTNLEEQAGFDEFFSIWNKLEEYENKL